MKEEASPDKKTGDGGSPPKRLTTKKFDFFRKMTTARFSETSIATPGLGDTGTDETKKELL